jgi:hypothetical protein
MILTASLACVKLWPNLQRIASKYFVSRTLYLISVQYSHKNVVCFVNKKTSSNRALYTLMSISYIHVKMYTLAFNVHILINFNGPYTSFPNVNINKECSVPAFVFNHIKPYKKHETFTN